MLALTLLACRIIDDVELQDRLADLDLDGFQSEAEGGADCDDGDPAVNPGADEVCGDGVDQDCDGGAGSCRAVGDVALAGAVATWGGPAAGDYLGARVGMLARSDGGRTAVVAAPLSDAVDIDGGEVFLFDRVVGDRPLSGADAHLVGPGEGAGFGGGLADAGDVDGDGEPDLLVGAAMFDHGGEDAGSAWLFAGPPRGDRTADTAAWRLIGTEAGGNAGFTMLGLGDVDGDGLGEVAIAAGGNLGGLGEVWLYRGPLAGEAGAADGRLYGDGDTRGLGSSLAAADVDGDGVAELWAGAHSTGEYAGAAWSFDVSSFGDVATSTAVAEVRGLAPDDLFGYRVAAGDLDGDGYEDLVAASPGAAEGAGEVALFRGPLAGAWTADDADATWIGEPGESLGSSLASAGDVDGDGWTDLLVGATGSDQVVPGGARLVYGPLLRDTPQALHLVGDAPGDGAGWDVAAGGDVTGDGAPDLLVGGYAKDAFAGAAWLWAGEGM